MSLLYTTGFDYYDTPQLSRIWKYSSGGASVVPGRFGGRAWGWTTNGGYLRTTIPNSTTVIVGMAFKSTVADPTIPFLLFQDGTTSQTNPITQVDFRLTSDFGFQATRNGTPLASTSGSLLNQYAFNTWEYFEFKVNINNSSGYVQAKVNGQVLLNSASLNTMYTGNNYVNMITFQPFFTTSSGAQVIIDDVYICNDAGTVNNDFRGECRVQTQYPTANGTQNDFTAIGAGANYQCVDDTIPDDDATYVRSGVVGNIDDYQMGTVNFSGTIYGVQVNVMHRKDDVGTRTIAPVVNSGGTVYTGNSYVCLSDYSLAQTIWEKDPKINGTWTNASVSALNAGLKIVA